MIFTILKGLALATGLFSLSGMSTTVDAPVAETVAVEQAATTQDAEASEGSENFADREAAAEAAIQAIEDEAGHDLVNVEFKDDYVVLRPAESFDEENDQEYFSEIMASLRALGYENIAAVGKPVYVENPEIDPAEVEALEAEEDVDVQALALPEVDPAFSHVIRA
ncbi:hypothetical protein [Corynebacterium oculi]|uniref:Uncharacterized protein n=1 Tax=Corynebacterium oculi TaxID=1544416 RepID=A0A0N8VZA3_9CORY|nr:hypothetical protein [Corynebacterium oculi]KQB83338.1 hypothetical protein Cocul_02313 [Corynebacterium oculi]